MRLEGKLLKELKEEINTLFSTYLDEKPSAVQFFGDFDGNTLRAVATTKCYSGYWYLRAAVVKPEYRGLGLQRKLMEERIEFIKQKTDVVRVSVYPDNFYSIRNIEAIGFEFEKMKTLKNGKKCKIYKKILK